MAYCTLNQAELGTMIEWISEIENSLNAMVFTVSLAYGAGEGLGVETRLRLAIEDIVKARRAFKQLLNDLEDNGQDNG